MHLSTRFPAHDRGDRTRQNILQIIKEDPTITVPNIAQKLKIHPVTVQRQKLNLRIAGLLAIALAVILYPLSGIASEVEGNQTAAGLVDDDSTEIEEVEEEAIEDDGDTTEIEA